MKLYMDSVDGSVPKRGDILQTNIGDLRERTCMILRVHRSARNPKRFYVWAERWWQMEPDFRMLLFRSAQRAGGQQVIYFERYHRKRQEKQIWDERLSEYGIVGQL